MSLASLFVCLHVCVYACMWVGWPYQMSESCLNREYAHMHTRPRGSGQITWDSIQKAYTRAPAHTWAYTYTHAWGAWAQWANQERFKSEGMRRYIRIQIRIPGLSAVTNPEEIVVRGPAASSNGIIPSPYCVYLYMNVCMYACVCMYVCMYICVYVCIHSHVCVCVCMLQAQMGWCLVRTVSVYVCMHIRTSVRCKLRRDDFISVLYAYMHVYMMYTCMYVYMYAASSKEMHSVARYLQIHI